MNHFLQIMNTLAPPNGRPVLVLFGTALIVAVSDMGSGYFFQAATVFSLTQLFASLGAVTLALSLSMILEEYDLSVAGSFALAAVVAVLTGGESPILGIACAIAVGALAGFLQGALVVTLRLPAVAVTLGGLLVLLGLTYLLANGGSIPYTNSAAQSWLQQSVGGLVSYRGLIIFGVYIIAAVVLEYTRIGRDIIAVGSNRSGASVAGVNSSRIIVGVFCVSGALSALGGALLAYSLAAASAIALSDVLVPATAAAILGGVSLGGGRGRSVGIACGVLTICLLRSGLSAVGAPPAILDIVTGAVLATVAIFDAPRLGLLLQKSKLS